MCCYTFENEKEKERENRLNVSMFDGLDGCHLAIVLKISRSVLFSTSRRHRPHITGQFYVSVDVTADPS